MIGPSPAKAAKPEQKECEEKKVENDNNWNADKKERRLQENKTGLLSNTWSGVPMSSLQPF